MFLKATKLLVILLCFVLPQASEATVKKTAKIFPITENLIIKTTVNQPKTVKKNTGSTKKASTSSTKNTSKTKTTSEQPKTTKSSTKNLKIEKTNKKERIKEPELKVKLGTGSYGQISISFPYGGKILNSKGKKIKSMTSKDKFKWTNDIKAQQEEYKKALKNKKKNKKLKAPKIEYLNETLSFSPNKSIFTINDKEYRGKITIKFTESGAIVINLVGMEDYLKGVVGSEIGANSPNESLKAQTVIARTYAYVNKGRHGSEGADICNTTHCQVYTGVKSECERVNEAIKATRGYILVHNGAPISALYHATCGGMTSDNDAVFGGAPRAYLRRVQCPYCTKGSKYRWNHDISVTKLQKALEKENVKLDDIYDVKLDTPAYMDRVSYLVFKTKSGEQKIKGTTIRRILDLPSTTFTLDNSIKSQQTINSSDTKGKLTGLVVQQLSEVHQSPKQLIVYSKKGLVRSIMPPDGWKSISYVSSDKPQKSKKLKTDTTNKNSITKIKQKELKAISNINIIGRGYGHQVGLCQSGAIEMGKQNWKYRQILAHYYQEVALKALGY